MLRFFWLLFALGWLAGCGNIAGKPLPMVDQDDPTWALTPDHLDNRSMVH